jgi:NADH-quinone oxidoreductase subunit A
VYGGNVRFPPVVLFPIYPILAQENAASQKKVLASQSQRGFNRGMELGQVEQYLAVLILLLAVVAVVGGMLGVHHLIAKRAHRTPVKDSAYECGLPAMTDDIPPVSVRYYRVAMLFILFDIEVVFLYAVAVVYKEMLLETPLTILIAILGFIFVLGVGLAHAWRKKALQFVK